jgi:hypothetical protein
VAPHDVDRLADLFAQNGQRYWIVGEAVEGAGAIEVA